MKADYILDFYGERLLPPEGGAIAVLQAVEKRITTEAGVHPIYSEGYGIRIFDLIGRDRLFAEVKLKERIKNAALAVDGVEAVTGVAVTAEGDSMFVNVQLKIKGQLHEIKEVKYIV